MLIDMSVQGQPEAAGRVVATLITCTRCKRERWSKARGLCNSCYTMVKRPPDYQAKRRKSERQRAQVTKLRDTGLTWGQIAAQLGLSETMAWKLGNPERAATHGLANRGTCSTCGDPIARADVTERCRSCATKALWAEGRYERIRGAFAGITTERVQPLIVRELTRLWGDDWDRKIGRKGRHATPMFDALAERCHVSESVIRKIARGTGNDHILPETLDKILCGLWQVTLWYLPPEKGGFLDAYDAWVGPGNTNAPEGALELAA